MNKHRSQVTEATRKAEAQEAEAPHGARATDAGAGSVDGHQVDEAVREHYRDMTDRGATEEGEGRIP